MPQWFLCGPFSWCLWNCHCWRDSWSDFELCTSNPTLASRTPEPPLGTDTIHHHNARNRTLSALWCDCLRDVRRTHCTVAPTQHTTTEVPNQNILQLVMATTSCDGLSKAQTANRAQSRTAKVHRRFGARWEATGKDKRMQSTVAWIRVEAENHDDLANSANDGLQRESDHRSLCTHSPAFDRLSATSS